MTDPAHDRETLVMWTVYDRPTNFPNTYVAVKFAVLKDGSVGATGEFMVGPTLGALRDYLAGLGLVPLMRSDTDDPKIVETWM